MPLPIVTPPLLNAAQAEFLLGPVAINMASRDKDGFPSLSRCHGCLVSPDRREVVVFVSRSRTDPLLRDLANGAPVAVVFCRPLTHETLQLKGERARLRQLEVDEWERMRAAGRAFAAESLALGFPDYFSNLIMASSSTEATAVVFTPVAVFEQTPGPKAGTRLEPRS